MPNALDPDDHAYLRRLPSGRWIGVTLQLWGNARLWVGDEFGPHDSF
jgi:hypothetical protein